MKVVICTFLPEDIDKSLEIINKKFNQEISVTVVALNFPVFRYAQKLGLTVKYSFTYFDQSKGNQYYKIAYRWASNWFKALGDIKVNGFSLGEIHTLPMLHYFGVVAKSFDIAKNILTQEKPGLVLVNANYTSNPYRRYVKTDFGLENVLLPSLAEAAGIPVVLIAPVKGSSLLLPTWKSCVSSLIQFIRSFSNIFSRPAPKTKLLFFAHYYQLANLLPLIDKAVRTKIPCVSVGKTSGTYPVPENFISYQKFSQPQDYLLLLFTSPVFIYRCVRLLKDQSLDPVVKNRLLYNFLVEYPLTFLELLQSRRVLKTIQPQTVIAAASTDTLDQTLVRPALRRKIKAIIPQHGVAGWQENRFYLADKIPVWGKIPYQIFNSSGISKNKLVITGYPYFDRYPLEKEPNKSLIKEKLGVSGHRVAIFLTAAPEGVSWLAVTANQEKILSDLILAVKQMPDFRLIVRSHPSNIDSLPYEIAKSLDYQLVSPKDSTLDELLAISDMVITQGTTAGLEAVIQGKKTIFLNTYRGKNIFKFLKDTSVTLTNFKDLKRIVWDTDWKKVLRRRKKMLADYCYRLDKKSGDRLLALVKKETNLPKFYLKSVEDN